MIGLARIITEAWMPAGADAHAARLVLAGLFAAYVAFLALPFLVGGLIAMGSR